MMKKIKNGLKTIVKSVRIEYIYILNFSLQLFLNIVISEPIITKKFITLLSFVLMLLSITSFVKYVYSNIYITDTISKEDVRILIIKFVLALMPIFLYYLYYLAMKIVLHSASLTNSEQQWDINIYFTLMSYIIYGILIIIHAKLSGFWEIGWKYMVLCSYLLLWVTFGYVFYSIDKDVTNSYTPAFSYSEQLRKDIVSRNIIENNEFLLDDFQKDDVKAIFNSDKDKIKLIDLNVYGQEIYLTNERIGENWAGYYYEQLIKKYNTFTIENVSAFKLTKDYLENVNYGKNYTEFLNKDYVIVKVILYNSDITNLDCILENRVFSEEKINNLSSEEKYLIFEKDNYENYSVVDSKLNHALFKNFLSESNTLLDDINTKFHQRNMQSSNSIVDYLYYSGVVITTLGFGDMTPILIRSRILTIMEAFLGLIIMGLFLAKAFENIKIGQTTLIDETYKSTEISPIAVTKVQLSRRNLSLIKENISVLSAELSPRNASNMEVVWESSDSNIATIDSNGKVTGIGEGIAIITCTAKDISGKYAKCKVTVINQVSVSTIKINKTKLSLKVGKTETVTAIITSAGVTNKALTWKSSDSNIATVNSNGKIRAKKTGIVTITCSAQDRINIAKCVVTIN